MGRVKKTTSPNGVSDGTARNFLRSMAMAKNDSDSDFSSGLMKDTGFWVAQILVCGLIVILGVVIWYVQN